VALPLLDRSETVATHLREQMPRPITSSSSSRVAAVIPPIHRLAMAAMETPLSPQVLTCTAILRHPTTRMLTTMPPLSSNNHRLTALTTLNMTPLVARVSGAHS